MLRSRYWHQAVALSVQPMSVYIRDDAIMVTQAMLQQCMLSCM